MLLYVVFLHTHSYIWMFLLAKNGRIDVAKVLSFDFIMRYTWWWINIRELVASAKQFIHTFKNIFFSCSVNELAHTFASLYITFSDIVLKNYFRQRAVISFEYNPLKHERNFCSMMLYACSIRINIINSKWFCFSYQLWILCIVSLLNGFASFIVSNKIFICKVEIQ